METTWRDRVLMWWVTGTVLLSAGFSLAPVWI